MTGIVMPIRPEVAVVLGVSRRSLRKTVAPVHRGGPAPRQRRNGTGTRWRCPSAGRRALLVVTHLNENGTCTDLATRFGIGTTAVFGCTRDTLGALTALAPPSGGPVVPAICWTFVVLGSTLPRIDRDATGRGRDRPHRCGEHNAHQVDVHVLTDPSGHPIWVPPHCVLDALRDAPVRTLASDGYRSAGIAVRSVAAPPTPTPARVGPRPAARSRSTPPTPRPRAAPTSAPTSDARGERPSTRSAAARTGYQPGQAVLVLAG